MQFKDVSVPEIYKESSDFRFFLDWFAKSLTRMKYDIENTLDCYDPLRCKSELLWLLADTMGFKYDDRLCIAFNRLVLMYFMSMIRNKGSKDGVTLAAEVNLGQFKINMLAGKGYTDDDGNKVEPNPILYERLEDSSIPVNSAYVTPHTKEGYIDVVYFSDEKPIDACIEYVRPLGMYCFQHAGVRSDSRTKISIDARLTDDRNIGMSIGPTHVGHYRRDDYARLQHSKTQTLLEDDNLTGYKIVPKYNYKIVKDKEGNPLKDDNGNTRVEVISTYYQVVSSRTKNGKNVVVKDNIPTKSEAASYIPKLFKNDMSDRRHKVWYRNSDTSDTDPSINPGYRALYSLQLCNNEQVVKSLIQQPIFSIGKGPLEVDVKYPDNYYKDKNTEEDYNLRYDKQQENDMDDDVYTIDEDRTKNILNPRPAVNPVMQKVGDAISMQPDSPTNTKYTRVDKDGNITVEDVDV